MSDIYTHDPVMDFTNPFLDFDQGYVRPFATLLPTVKVTLIPIPSEEELILPKKPLTRKERFLFRRNRDQRRLNGWQDGGERPDVSLVAVEEGVGEVLDWVVGVDVGHGRG